jgi:hypothetical protein
MATARSTRQGPAKPRGAAKPKAPPRERFAPLDVLPVIEAEEEEPIPAPPPVPECEFPFEMSKGRCPVAVFNAPGDTCSMNESLSFPRAERRGPLKFSRGVLAAFTEEDAGIVRAANPGGRLYVEADPRFSHGPLICDTCYPKTRWYSTAAYQRHTKRAHTNG